MKKDESEAKEVHKDEKQQVHQEASDYNFIREQIRVRPVNRKRLIHRTLLTAGMAVLFGLVACLTFLILQPKLSKWLSSEEDMEKKVVSLSEQNEEEEKPKEQVLTVAEDEPEQLVIETPIEEMSLNDDDVPVSGNQTENVSENQTVEEPPKPTEAVIEQQIVYEQIPLELEDYRQLYRKMYALSEEVEKSLVTITPVSGDMDWAVDSENEDSQTVGLVVAENGYELLILANSEVLDTTDTLRVTFFDGSGGELTEKAVDYETGLGIYAIPLMAIDKDSRSKITAATLGSSYASSILGNAVMAVGRPLGTESICYGAVTSASRMVSMQDASYQLLTTDIYGSRQASGVIVNVRGQVAGFICQSHNEDGMENMIYAYGISSIRKLIENLSNGKERAYLGLYISEVLPEAAEELGIPKGVYVSQVEMDSPALSAGLSRGDIIQKVNGMDCFSINEYMNAMQNCEPETEVTVTFARSDGIDYRSMDVTLMMGKK